MYPVGSSLVKGQNVYWMLNQEPESTGVDLAEPSDSAIRKDGK